MPPPFLGALTNFAVFLFLVLRFAGPSMSRFVRERHDGIAKQISEATRLRDEAQRRLEEYTLKLTGLQAEIERLVSEIRADAENDRRRIIGEAEARAERMKRDAAQQIQAEINRVMALLERETVVQAVAIAEKLIRERAGKAEQRELADRFVKALERQRPERNA
jgi:F-type H+-transporting ATPase subunit b